MVTKETVGKVLGKAVRILPGIGSYQDRESIRESDKRLRDCISNALMSCVKALEDLKRNLALRENFFPLSDLDTMTRNLDRVARTITFSARGYAAVFESRKIDEQALLSLFEFDKLFQEEVNLLEPLVLQVSESGDNVDEAKMEEIRSLLKKIEKRVDKREEFLRDLAD